MNVLPSQAEDPMAPPQCALHEHRLARLEEDVRDLREVPTQLALVRQSLDGLRIDLAARPVALSRGEVEAIVAAHAGGPSLARLAAAVGAPSGIVAWLLYYGASIAAGTPPAPPPMPVVELPDAPDLTPEPTP